MRFLLYHKLYYNYKLWGPHAYLCFTCIGYFLTIMSMDAYIMTHNLQHYVHLDVVRALPLQGVQHRAR